MMKKILMVCEAFGGGVFTYVSQLCNDMCDEFDVYLAYALRAQTPENYKDFLNKKVNLIEIKNMSAKGLGSISNYIKVRKELLNIEAKVKPDIIHLHSSIAGGIGRLVFKGKENVIVYTPHGYAHILMGSGVKCKVYGALERVLGKFSKTITLTCCESEDEVAKTLTAYIETGINITDLSNSLDSIQTVKRKIYRFYVGKSLCSKAAAII